MKPFTLVLILYLFSTAAWTQRSDFKPEANLSRHSIMVTPLMDLLGGQKSSVYYQFRMPLATDSSMYLSFRLGSEGWSRISNTYSTGRMDEATVRNGKFGAALSKMSSRIETYIGLELSRSQYRGQNGIMQPAAE
ncbi:MAG: hypothetical protein D6772_11530 [Bacteroidetes bacterium]|nr:MAG: hypothetical protein D6772_11530 [Bacteroidota bacterium]